MMARDLNATDLVPSLGTFTSGLHKPLVLAVSEGVPRRIHGFDLGHDWQDVQQTVLNGNSQDFPNDDDVLGFGRMRQRLLTIPIKVRQIIPNHTRCDLGDIMLPEIADQTVFGPIQQLVVTLRPFRLAFLHSHQLLGIMFKAGCLYLGVVAVGLASETVGKLVSHFHRFESRSLLGRAMDIFPGNRITEADKPVWATGRQDDGQPLTELF